MATSPHDPSSLSEQDAHRVLARAAELDARAAAEISVAQLQQIAEEAGIGIESLTQALQELQSGALVDVLPARRRSLVLVEQLVHYRWPALLVLAVGAACVTPGDAIITALLHTVPVFALYQAVVRRVRGGGQAGPSSPSSGEPSRDLATPPTTRTSDGSRPHGFPLRFGSVALAM